MRPFIAHTNIVEKAVGSTSTCTARVLLGLKENFFDREFNGLSVSNSRAKDIPRTI